MKDGLAAVGVRIHHDAVALIGEVRFARQLAREVEQRAEQRRIFCVVQRCDVLRRDYQQMRRRLDVAMGTERSGCIRSIQSIL